MNEILKSKLEPISISELTTPREGSVVMVNRWWVTDGENVFVYNGYSPQCNSSKIVARDIGMRLYGMDVVLIPVAYYMDRYRGTESTF